MLQTLTQGKGVVQMLYCEKCGMHIAGKRTFCPLCSMPLREHGESTPEIFPAIPWQDGRTHLFLRLLIFLSIAVTVVCCAVNAMLPQTGAWSLFVAGGVACMWISVSMAIRKRGNIYKNILWQAFLLSALAVLWDLLTRWRGWSLDYALPIILAIAIVTMTVIARCMKLRIQDYMVYLLIDMVFGMIPVALLAAGVLQNRLPSIVSITVTLIHLAALIVFEGKNILLEIRKLLHL